jgi:anhydro-N-acetylmuramic acid kinase
MRALGLMSGTSVDGVDVALIETDGERVTSFGPTLTVPYPDEVRRLIRAAFAAEQPSETTAAAERAVTQTHVAAAKLWSATHGVPLSSLDVAGFHGQTITHRPERHFTWQIGDGSGLARALGVRVVNDLRGADVAAGGQGAPLVPVFHAALVRDLPRPVAVVNIGGVANVTWIGEDGSLLAFDTGPGNGPIDDWCARRAGQRFDRDGALAASGKVDRARLERWAEHRYFARKPPKSLDRGDFNDTWVDGLSAAAGARDADPRHGARDFAGGASFPAPGEAMDRHRRWRPQSDLADGDRGGDRRARGDGLGAGLGRRCAGSPGLCLPGGALVARPAAHLPDHHRRAPAAQRRASAPAGVGPA